MTPERWREVKSVCQRALDCEPGGRDAFLAAACGDDVELLGDVQALLVQATESPGILDAPVWRRVGLASAETVVLPEGPGARWLPETVGRYRVLRPVGEGGMGAVYEAEQDHPRRVVALKVIKLGLPSREALRRFERESQALGRLQHPGIAQIYEAGTADTGLGPQPYFAMELIRGEPLTDYATAHGLDVRARLELVARICEAVQHAHGRGLIHRDLKPANILVDRTGQPKILDFGVARLADGGPTPGTLQTDAGQLVGTLAYMSPEQVLADPLELDTRSDVYALGVILYELLAGRLPYAVSGRVHEAVQTIRDQDPARLSAVHRSYRGDIETIVGKALEKDKTRRYASAAALAEDIRRYLADQPITARSASATYQLRKFARRHKAVVGGVAAVFAVLVAGIVVSTWQAQRATAAQRLAVAAEDRVVKERDEVTKERNRAVAAQEAAQRERNQAMAEKLRADTEAATAKAVSEFLRRDLLAQASAKTQSRPDTKPDPDLRVRTALDRAAARIGSTFESQPLVEASVRQTIGTAYQDLGLYPQARQQLERAFELRKKTLGEQDPATLELVRDLAGSDTLEGKYPEAVTLYMSALDSLRRAQGEEAPAVLSTMADLANVYQYQGKYPQAEALIRKVLQVRRRVDGAEHPDTIDTTSSLAFLSLNQGKYREAESLYAEALEKHRRVLGTDHPTTLGDMNGLAMTHNGLGKRGEAEGLWRQVLDAQRRVLGTDHPDTLITMNNLALMYTGQGRFREAEPLYAEALATKRRLLGPEHPDTLLGMNNLGNLYSEEGKFSDAEPLFTLALDGRRRVLGRDHPNTLNTLTNVAQLYFRQGRWKESEALFTEIMATRRRVLGDEHPSTLLTMNHLAFVYARLGKLPEAESLLTSVLDKWRRTFGSNHSQVWRTTDQLGDVSLRRGDSVQASRLFSNALEGMQSVLGREHPDTLRASVDLAASHRELGQTREAEARFIEALSAQRKLLGDDHPDTLAAMTGLAALYLRQGKQELAQTLLTEASRGRQRVFGPRHPDTIEDLSLLGWVYLQQRKYPEVETLLKDVTTQEKSSADTWYRFEGESILGIALAAEQKYAEAEKLLVDGYEGMFERASTMPAPGRTALDRAGQEIVQLYQAWGKPERAVEWRERLSVRH